MFKKILIANRGEIACRVMKTAKRMGIATVAVYSDADKDALHVRMADEAVHIGASPSAESYLVKERIIQACKDTGAEAVHPGYGFLSENAHFNEVCRSCNIDFIGPQPEAMELLGDKNHARELARSAKVPVVPGSDGWPEAYEYAVGGRTLRFPVPPDGPSPILHLTLFHPLDDHYGFAPIEAAATALDIHNAAGAWNKALLDNAARPSGALVYQTKEGGNLSAEQFERLKAERDAVRGYD